MKTKLLMLAMLVPGLANAQVMLEQNQAESGSYYKGVLTVTQGCDGSATTAITVDIPEGLQFAQPMPKAGWQLEIVKKPVERPFFKDGIEITEAVRQITWSGNTLSDNHFDEFIFRGRIGVGATVVLYFPVTQKCETGELHWDQIADAEPVKTRGQQQGLYREMDVEEDSAADPHQAMNHDMDHSADHSQHKSHQHKHQHQHGQASDESGPKAVKELMEDMEALDEKQAEQPKAHQHHHQHDHKQDEAEHSGDHGEPKAHQHQHGQQMEMTEEDDGMDHSAHAGHGQSTLQYPAPFVKVVDGTGEHHHH